MAWNQEQLENVIQGRLDQYQIILVSNREPYMHVYRNGEMELIMPASGMAIALDAVMQTIGGTWVAAGSGEADQEAIAGNEIIHVPPDNPKYRLRRLWLTREEEQGFYYGFSNETLWPLCHVCYARPEFSRAYWEYYQQVNKKFAETILEEVGKRRTIVFIQDYHFALLPRILKEKAPDLIVCQFWHIPWPNYEVFRICPWGQEILEGLLGNDLLGFHLQYHCNNFFDTVDRTLEARVDYEKFAVVRQGRTSYVRPFPISIDYDRFEEISKADETLAQMSMIQRRFNLQGVQIGLGVDRLDYTKGIPERLEAIKIFFRKYPNYQQRFTFIQLGPVSRLHIPQYKNLNARVDSLEEEINSTFARGRWKPIILIKSHLSQAEIVPFYRLADIMLVSSLHDGMNLVAKEYVASRIDKAGALLLSPFTGAKRELPQAYEINPYDPEETADVIYQALEDDLTIKANRLEAMQGWIREHNIYWWAGEFFKTLMDLTVRE